MKSFNKNIAKFFSSASHTSKKKAPSFNISENFHNTYIKELERQKAAK
jgi:hypothetical protein